MKEPKLQKKNTVYSIRKEDHSKLTDESKEDRSSSPKPRPRRPRGKGPTRFRGEGELLGEFERQFRRNAEWERQKGRDAADLLSFHLDGDGEALTC